MKTIAAIIVLAYATVASAAGSRVGLAPRTSGALVGRLRPASPSPAPPAPAPATYKAPAKTYKAPAPAPAPKQKTSKPAPEYKTPKPAPEYKAPAQDYKTPTPAPEYKAPTHAPDYKKPTQAPDYKNPTPTPGYTSPTQAPDYKTPTPTPGYTSPTQAPDYKTPTPAPEYVTPTPKPVEKCWTETKKCCWKEKTDGYECVDHYAFKYAVCHPKISYKKDCEKPKTDDKPKKPKTYVDYGKKEQVMYDTNYGPHVEGYPAGGESKPYESKKLPTKPYGVDAEPVVPNNGGSYAPSDGYVAPPASGSY